MSPINFLLRWFKGEKYSDNDEPEAVRIKKVIRICPGCNEHSVYSEGDYIILHRNEFWHEGCWLKYFDKDEDE